jgi:orotate phosphoribosyltransferase
MTVDDIGAAAFPGARDRLAQTGLSLHPLATWSDVLRADAGGRSALQSRNR